MIRILLYVPSTESDYNAVIIGELVAHGRNQKI